MKKRIERKIIKMLDNEIIQHIVRITILLLPVVSCIVLNILLGN